MAWTEERVEQLKTLWSEGLSAAQIANKMGGVTRNAVIGKVHRLGLSGRATPAKPKRGCSTIESKEDAPVGAKPPIDIKPVIPEPDFIAPAVLESGDRMTVATIKNNMCKWPIGDPATDDFTFAGSRRKPANLIARITPTWPSNHHSGAQIANLRHDERSPNRKSAAPRDNTSTAEYAEAHASLAWAGRIQSVTG